MKPAKLLLKAINAGDKNKIIEAYYKHASELDEEERLDLYKEMLEKYPDDVKSGRAFVAVLNENGQKYNFDSFMAFVTKLDKNNRAKFLQNAWYKIKGFGDDKKKAYLEHVMKEKYETADFYIIYGELKAIAFKLKLSYDIEQALEALKNQMFEKISENERNA